MSMIIAAFEDRTRALMDCTPCALPAELRLPLECAFSSSMPQENSLKRTDRLARDALPLARRHTPTTGGHALVRQAPGRLSRIGLGNFLPLHPGENNAESITRLAVAGARPAGFLFTHHRPSPERLLSGSDLFADFYLPHKTTPEEIWRRHLGAETLEDELLLAALETAAPTSVHPGCAHDLRGIVATGVDKMRQEGRFSSDDYRIFKDLAQAASLFQVLFFIAAVSLLGGLLWKKDRDGFRSSQAAPATASPAQRSIRSPR
jgi:hypothetical protein